jgi:predicted O-methyltransferase YrrM
MDLKDIRKYLKNKGFKYFEGSLYNQKEQIELYNDLLKNKKNGLQIGFNAGDSANLFLSINEGILLSIDINSHEYVEYANEYINNKYPNRHKLIVGDSTLVLPKLEKNIYDYIFIDGGHSFKVANQDIINCKNFSNKNTLIIIDDYVENEEWIRSYNKGVIKAVNNNIDFIKLGQKDFGKGRGIIWGFFKN